VTHDRATMPAVAYEPVLVGNRMPGVIVITHRSPVGRAMDELVLVSTRSEASECVGRVLYLPLKAGRAAAPKSKSGDGKGARYSFFLPNRHGRNKPPGVRICALSLASKEVEASRAGTITFTNHEHAYPRLPNSSSPWSDRIRT
jgi:hypothetical protein